MRVIHCCTKLDPLVVCEWLVGRGVEVDARDITGDATLHKATDKT
jgi:hypothetical protein